MSVTTPAVRAGNPRRAGGRAGPHNGRSVTLDSPLMLLSSAIVSGITVCFIPLFGSTVIPLGTPPTEELP